MGFKWTALPEGQGGATLHGDAGDFCAVVARLENGSTVWRVERVDPGELVERGTAPSLEGGAEAAVAALARARGDR